MQKNAKAMVLASFAADSFALGTHWIYDTAKIEQQFGRISSLLSPHEGSYHPTKKRGDFTHYGDQAYHLLLYLADNGGHFDATQYGSSWQSFMADYQGYMDHASKDTLKNMAAGRKIDACGSQSTDLGGAARIAPLIYCHRENLDQMLTAVRAQTILTHRGPGAVDGALFLARSSHSILQGATPREAIKNAVAHVTDNVELYQRLEKCFRTTDDSTGRVIKEYGQMCAISAALPGAVYTVLKYEDNLEEALIETVMAGGDSAARGMVVGMLLGAYHGKEQIPARWLDQLNTYEKIENALRTLP